VGAAYTRRMRSEDLELGFLALPDAGSHPGVVMVHDVWGVSDHTRDLAGRLAAEGFAVLAVDLYRHLAEVKIENPGTFMRELSDPQVLAHIQVATDHLSQRSETRGHRVGVTGFCMGGMYALMAACSCDGLAAAVPYYGLLSHAHGLLHDPQGLDPLLKPRSPLDLAPELGCPLLGFFGGRDDFVPVSDVRELEARLARSGQPAEIVVYPECGHAFMNDTRPDAYRPTEAAEAWQRMLEFLGDHLRGG
jgi:carboxymethylenebutenolidase